MWHLRFPISTCQSKDAQSSIFTTEAAEIDSWIFPMLGSDVGELVSNRAGTPLFARNIRGHLGNVKINKEIRRPSRSSPLSFSTSTTASPSSVTMRRRKSRKVGRRFTSPILRLLTGSKRLTHLPMAAGRPRKQGCSSESSRCPARLVKRGLATTNTHWSTRWPHKLSDNGETRRPQVERSSPSRTAARIPQAPVLLCPKRGDTGDKPGSAVQQVIKMEDVAKAVVGCEDASFTRNEGMQALFEGQKYKSIFNHTPEHLLSCWWLAEDPEGGGQGNGNTPGPWGGPAASLDPESSIPTSRNVRSMNYAGVVPPTRTSSTS